jgi:hypothetical protein
MLQDNLPAMLDDPTWGRGEDLTALAPNSSTSIAT